MYMNDFYQGKGGAENERTPERTNCLSVRYLMPCAATIKQKMNTLSPRLLPALSYTFCSVFYICHTFLSNRPSSSDWFSASLSCHFLLIQH